MVDRSKFKSCDQSKFCHRLSKLKSNETRINHSSFISCSEGEIIAEFEQNNRDKILVNIQALVDNRVRIKIDEKNASHARLDIFKDLWSNIQPEPVVDRSAQTTQSSDKCSVNFQNGHSIILQTSPFRIIYTKEGVPVITLNARDLFLMEPHIKKKPVKIVSKEEGEFEIVEENIEQETFSGVQDSLPRGQQGISLDVRFHNFQNIYGIPEHADSFALKLDMDEPYRLFNLDVFEYELNNPMALYGSVPYLTAHNTVHSVGFSWLNAAETWVKLDRRINSRKYYIFPDVKDSDIDCHWMSESGILDVILFVATTPREASRKFAQTFGYPQLPPLFSLGYHQSRWNYDDERDVELVNHQFDRFSIPVDVIWLDIEYTEGKKYFTWDQRKFPDPPKMQEDLLSLGRKLVTIVDCHVKRENNYFVYEQAKNNDYLVKTSTGSQFDGWCWPGSSVYPDFINPQVREWWSNMYSVEKFKGTTDIQFIWNDMNEPSVFNGPEVTLPKDALHYQNWENRDIHNLYGFFFHLSTYEGLLKRSPNQRPFVLTRSFFIGTQKYSAVWTGDNTADWGHLKMSVPMVLSLNIAGIVFSGADVGGFFGNPSEELLIRWYQAGAFQPFYRSHSHIETKRREPYLFNNSTMDLIRQAIIQRYNFIPYLYTLFYFAHTAGWPIMRPLWFEFENDTNTFNIEDQYMFGDSLMVKPITSPQTSSTSVYFPTKHSTVSVSWFNIYDYTEFNSGSTAMVSAPLSQIPLFQLSGTIIPKWNRNRRSTEIMKRDPYTLEVCLDSKAEAKGSLYLDDGTSFDNEKGLYKLIEYRFRENKLSSRLVLGSEDFLTPESCRIERIVINCATNTFTNAAVHVRDSIYNVSVDSHSTRRSSYIIRDPKFKVDESFLIILS